ncbi:arginyltransferase [Fontivita pretiosa]|jgi:arginine-tRNA-protein transferase|uniref:arginyltransferase n=1 Tax=Fontivita pretiosa TaxID=2989684 RepID=UPI003D186EE3
MQLPDVSAQDVGQSGSVHRNHEPEQEFSHYPSWPAPLPLPLVTLPEHPCVYLPGRMAQMRALVSRRVPPMLYHALMDAGFRRSGDFIYQPACRGCRQCMPLRVLVEQFRPSKSQRRCLKRNADVQVAVDPRPRPTDEKLELYYRYLREWHGQVGPDDEDDRREEFVRFLYDSPVQTIEFTYRDADGRLLAVGICDVCAASLSSVYCFFDPSPPAARRGLGTYAALCEIRYARDHCIPYYYLGYWVYGCSAMQYKSGFRPHQLLGTDGRWRQPAGRDRP